MQPSKFAFLFLTSLLLSSCQAGSQQTESQSSVAAVSSALAPESISSSPRSTKNGTYHFYCVNDFHGTVEESNEGYYQAGIEKVMGELAALKAQDPEHTFVFSAGDMWQGSLESNSNYGAFVTEAMNESFDAMCLGNHEFDYGVDRISENQKLAHFPFLAGNIRLHEHPEQSWGKTSASTIIERGGIKLGVVGMIGEGQTTSIASQNVANLDFIDPEEPAEAEAKRLREEENCDMVLLLLHSDAASVIGGKVGSTRYEGWENASSLGDYFNGVFTAHTHTKNLVEEDGVPLVQSYCNGEAISSFSMSYQDGVVKKESMGIISASSDWPESQNAKDLYAKYIVQSGVKAKAESIVGTLQGGSLNSYGVARLGCKAIYEAYKPKYPSLVLAMENHQRASIPSGDFTYGELYKATPFMNGTVIMLATGKDIKNEAKYNETYTGDAQTYSTLDDEATYTVAVIDYIAYHMGTDKLYDYFPSLNAHYQDYWIAEEEKYPADLTAEYVQSISGKTINAGDFSSSSTGFDLYAA